MHTPAGGRAETGTAEPGLGVLSSSDFYELCNFGEVIRFLRASISSFELEDPYPSLPHRGVVRIG